MCVLRGRKYTLMKTKVVCLSGGLMKPLCTDTHRTMCGAQVYFVYSFVYVMQTNYLLVVRGQSMRVTLTWKHDALFIMNQLLQSGI